jgi:hypothetical protein
LALPRDLLELGGSVEVSSLETKKKKNKKVLLRGLNSLNKKQKPYKYTDELSETKRAQRVHRQANVRATKQRYRSVTPTKVCCNGL